MSHSHPLDLLIRQFARRSPLSEQDQQAIRSLPYTMRMLEAGSYIVREADKPRTVGILLGGFAYRHKLTGDGARQIVSLHLPGEALDLPNLFLDVSDHSCQMLTRAEVAVVQRSDLQELAWANPAISRAIMIRLLVESSITREWVLNVGRRSAKARAAHLLCELAVRLEAEGLADRYGYELPMTQEQVGDALGLTSVHVNRTLKALELDGLIVRSKRMIQFTNWQAMRSVADFNERYLHLERQDAAAVPGETADRLLSTMPRA